jgi:transposase
MLHVESARWGQTPADLRQLAMSAPHPRTRERFLALYEITQENCATRVAERTRRHPQTVMEWLHLYNTRGPEALVYQRTGGRPPFARRSRAALARQSVPPNAQPQRRR